MIHFFSSFILCIDTVKKYHASLQKLKYNAMLIIDENIKKHQLKYNKPKDENVINKS